VSESSGSQYNLDGRPQRRRHRSTVLLSVTDTDFDSVDHTSQAGEFVDFADDNEEGDSESIEVTSHHIHRL
jgi:hypothetical protein